MRIFQKNFFLTGEMRLVNQLLCDGPNSKTQNYLIKTKFQSRSVQEKRVLEKFHRWQEVKANTEGPHTLMKLRQIFGDGVSHLRMELYVMRV